MSRTDARGITMTRTVDALDQVTFEDYLDLPSTSAESTLSCSRLELAARKRDVC